MIKRFCDRCETELSGNNYVSLSMHAYSSGHYNKNVELCYKCAELILETLKRY